MAHKRQFSCLAFVIVFGFLCQVLNAANFNVQHEPQGPLKIRLDYELASRDQRQYEGAHQWVFSTHLTFKNDVEDVTPGQLRKLAEDAYKEMEVDILQYDPKLDKKKKKPVMQPGVMTILAFEKEIYLSSSQKGQSAYIDEVEDSIFKEQLELCKIIWAEFGVNPDSPDHKNGRKCGEVMVFHQFSRVHRRRKLTDISPLARAATVHVLNGKLEIIPPCGTDKDNQWGCDVFLLNPDGPGKLVRYLPDDVESEEYDLSRLAGGVEHIDQIRSCS